MKGISNRVTRKYQDVSNDTILQCIWGKTTHYARAMWYFMWTRGRLLSEKFGVSLTASVHRYSVIISPSPIFDAV